MAKYNKNQPKIGQNVYNKKNHWLSLWLSAKSEFVDSCRLEELPLNSPTFSLILDFWILKVQKSKDTLLDFWIINYHQNWSSRSALSPD